MKPQRKKSSSRPVGWSVSQPLRRKTDGSDAGEKYLRNLWVSRRGGFYRLALAGLTVWGASYLVGSSHGILRLRALGREEASLKARLALVTEENRQAQHELRENPALGMERGLREKYLKSRPGEIIYHLQRVEGAGEDSASWASGGLEEVVPGEFPPAEESGGYDDPEVPGAGGGR